MWIKREPEWSRGRLISILFGSFAALALILSAVGLYSVVSYSAAQRTNEFGIRLALGAQKGDVLRNVFSSAGVSVGFGLVAGVTLSVGLNRLISSWVENSASSALMLIGTCVVLLFASGLACLIPSWRASSVDPMTALRCE
jgi:ABC-type antimicrobial peptide transport system permease subunit